MVTITYCGKAIMQSCFVRIISVLQIWNLFHNDMTTLNSTELYNKNGLRW
jgi:hypothetical protein